MLITRKTYFWQLKDTLIEKLIVNRAIWMWVVSYVKATCKSYTVYQILINSFMLPLISKSFLYCLNNKIYWCIFVTHKHVYWYDRILKYVIYSLNQSIHTRCPFIKTYRHTHAHTAVMMIKFYTLLDILHITIFCVTFYHLLEHTCVFGALFTRAGRPSYWSVCPYWIEQIGVGGISKQAEWKTSADQLPHVFSIYLCAVYLTLMYFNPCNSNIYMMTS